MKKFIYGLGALLMMFSCAPLDNYESPSETLYGKIIDKKTGETVQCEAGSAGIRIQLMEYSWSDNPTPLYLQAKMDGTYYNSKVFKGTYGILPEGPFVPLKQFDEETGKVTVDETVTVKIKGSVEQNFEVEPFLRIEWVSEPYVEEDGKISVEVRITRGTDNPDYQHDLCDLGLYLSPTKYLGNNDYVSKFSRLSRFTGDKGNINIGETIKLTSKAAPTPNQTWFLRVGARINCPIGGTPRFNYSTVKSIDL